MINYIYERQIKKTLKNCLLMLANLQQAFFVNYLRKDYIKHQLRYQKSLNTHSRRFFCSIVKARSLVERYPKFIDVFNRIEHISEIIFSLNQLRFRITDYTTFKICTRELEGIEKFSKLLLIQLAKSFFKKEIIDTNEFEEKIHAFEAIYNRTLQIVSVDPLVFMFFIQDLYALHDEMQVLYQSILLLSTKNGKANA